MSTNDHPFTCVEKTKDGRYFVVTRFKEGQVVRDEYPSWQLACQAYKKITGKKHKEGA